MAEHLRERATPRRSPDDREPERATASVSEATATIQRLQRTAGNAAVARWLSDTGTLARKSGLLPPEQAARYASQAEEEGLKSNHTGSALLYTRAFRSQKSFDHALAAAKAFEAAGDVDAATSWYRKVLETPQAAGDKDTAQTAARTALHNLGKAEQPTYKMRVEVKDEYVRISKQILGGLGIDHDRMHDLKREGLTKEQISAADVLKQQQNTLRAEVDAAERETDAAEKLRKKNAAQEKFTQAVDKLRVVLTDLAGYKVAYVPSNERANFRLNFDGAKIIQGPPPGDPAGYSTAACYSKEAGAGYAIFVMSPDGAIYAAEHKVGRFHHSSFLAGGEASGAGELKVHDGRLIALTNKSGHYTPTYVHVAQTLREFRSTLRQDLSAVEVILHMGKVVRWKTRGAGFLALFDQGAMKPGAEVSKVLGGEEESDEAEILSGPMP